MTATTFTGLDAATPAGRGTSAPASRNHARSIEYAAPFWLPGGHSQTLYAACLVTIPAPAFERQSWSVDKHGQIPVDIAHGSSRQPVLVLIHGLDGNARSHYVRALAHHFNGMGWTVVVPHFRTIERDLTHGLHHSRRMACERIDQMVRQIATRYEARRLFAVGVSLGGNLLLRWLAGGGSAVKRIDAAAVVSAPVDLAGCFDRVSRGLARIYHWYFRQLRNRQDAASPAGSGASLPRKTSAWANGTTLEDLKKICTPTLLLNARNDPCLSDRCFPAPEEVSGALTLEYTRDGGHVGFVTGEFPGRFDWLPQRLTRFFAMHCDRRQNSGHSTFLARDPAAWRAMRSLEFPGCRKARPSVVIE